MCSWDFDEQALAARAEELIGGTAFPFQMMVYAGTVAYARYVALDFGEEYEQRFDESFGEGAWRALSPKERGRVLAATAHEHFIADMDLTADDFHARMWDEPTPETAGDELKRIAAGSAGR